MIEGTGPRYCPSIEDKVVRFSDKPRHQAFVEPVGLDTEEMYIQGMSSSLPEDVQIALYHTISGLENAEYVKFGRMHKNTYINSPSLLDETYNFKKDNNIFFAGQITGVEGYVESAASGMVAGINMAKYMLGEDLIEFPRETAMGSMAYYITHTSQDGFQPMNANFGILPKLEENIRDKKVKYQKMADRSLDILKIIKENV